MLPPHSLVIKDKGEQSEWQRGRTKQGVEEGSVNLPLRKERMHLLSVGRTV